MGHKCDGCSFKSEHQEMGFKPFGACTKYTNLIEAQKAYEAEKCPFKRENRFPTMSETLTLITSATFYPGRSNSKSIQQGHINNICSAVSKQVEKEAIIIKSRRDFKNGTVKFQKDVNLYQCPGCFNYVKHSQRHCDKCGQALIYDY